MAPVPDFAPEWPGVVKNFLDAGLSTCEEFLGAAVFRPADDLAVHSILSLRPGSDPQLVYLFSTLHAAPVGWHRAIACHLHGREKIGRVSAVVCAVVRANALQVAQKLPIAIGFRRSGHCNIFSVLDCTRNDTSVLGPLSDA